MMVIDAKQVDVCKRLLNSWRFAVTSLPMDAVTWCSCFYCCLFFVVVFVVCFLFFCKFRVFVVFSCFAVCFLLLFLFLL